MEVSEKAKEDKISVNVLQSKKSTKREKQKAFEKLYSKYQRSLAFYFYKNVKDRDAAEDLMMITFEKVHSKIESYNSKIGAFSTWMYKIALNTLIDYKRKGNFEQLSLDAISTKTADDNDGMEFQIPSSTLSPEEELVRNENIKTVRAAIDSIESEDIRRIMTYRYIDELTFEEIAELEGVSKDCSTIRVSAMRGQGCVKKALEAQK